jgi:hypothetical protein
VIAVSGYCKAFGEELIAGSLRARTDLSQSCSYLDAAIVPVRPRPRVH